MRFLPYAAALVAGICNSVEPGQNASLAKALGHPWLAGLICLVVNAVIFTAIGLSRHDLVAPSLAHVSRVPWWAWLGGLTGAFLIATQLFVSEEIGAARFVGLVVTAGVVTSIVLDNYGLVGFETHPVNIWRIVGGVLMIGGVTLVAVF